MSLLYFTVLKIARLVKIVKENEQNSEVWSKDDINFDEVSDSTLAFLYDFVFSCTKPIEADAAEQKQLIEYTRPALNEIELENSTISWILNNETIEVQLPYVEGQPKIKYIFSKDAWSTMFSKLNISPTFYEAANFANIRDVKIANDDVGTIATLFAENWFTARNNEQQSEEDSDKIHEAPPPSIGTASICEVKNANNAVETITTLFAENWFDDEQKEIDETKPIRMTVQMNPVNRASRASNYRCHLQHFISDWLNSLIEKIQFKRNTIKSLSKLSTN